MRRGEIWWYQQEGAKRRPYLVLTRNEAIDVLTSLMGVPATRTIRGIPSEVRIDERHGMPAACVLTLDNVTVVRKANLISRITTLDAAVLDEVCEAMAFASGCT